MPNHVLHVQCACNGFPRNAEEDLGLLVFRSFSFCSSQTQKLARSFSMRFEKCRFCRFSVDIDTLMIHHDTLQYMGAVSRSLWTWHCWVYKSPSRRQGLGVTRSQLCLRGPSGQHATHANSPGLGKWALEYVWFFGAIFVYQKTIRIQQNPTLIQLYPIQSTSVDLIERTRKRHKCWALWELHHLPLLATSLKNCLATRLPMPRDDSGRLVMTIV